MEYKSQGKSLDPFSALADNLSIYKGLPLQTLWVQASYSGPFSELHTQLPPPSSSHTAKEIHTNFCV